jgi:hypothetical protein
MKIHRWLGVYALGVSLSVFGYSGSTYDLLGIQITPLGSASELSIGTLPEIGRFRITNPSRKKIMLRSIAIRNYGTARLDESLLDASLWISGNQISSRSWIDLKNIYFSTHDYIIGSGDSVIIDVKATVQFAHDGETIQLGIRRPEDFVAIEVGSGFAVGLPIDSTPAQMKTYTLSPGAISVQRTPTYRNSFIRPVAPSSQTNQYIPNSYYSTYLPRVSLPIQSPVSTYRMIGSQTRSPGSKEVNFLDFYLSQKMPVRADGIFFEIDASSLSSDKNGNGIDNEIDDFNDTFNTFQLYINGLQEDSSNSIEYYRGQAGVFFDTSFDLLGGENHFQVTGRIKNNATNGDKLKLRGGNTFLISPEYIYSGDAVPSSKIHGSPTGNSTNVNASSWFLYQ